MSMMRLIKPLILNMIAWVLSLIVIIPFLVVILNSFKSDSESTVLNLSLPKKFLFENYRVVIEQGHLFSSFLNSLLYAVVSSVLLVIVVAFAAFVLSRNQSKLNKFIYLFLILGITLPMNYIPLMSVMKSLHLINTQTGMVLLYTAMGIPISLFITYAFVSNVPRELDEAAIMDGCNGFSLFFRVIVPLLKPVLVTIFVLNFLGVWNEFTAPLYLLNSIDKWPYHKT